MLNEFLQELRRRRVIRVALAYIVCGWVIIQVAATVFPIIEAPSWALKLVLVLVAVGFPAALAISWAFDLTDGGLQRTPPTHPVEHRAWTYVRIGHPGRPPFLKGRTRYMVAGTLLLVALSAGGWFALDSGAGEAAALDESLVAVLPFRVTGADPSLAYLREGMVDLLAVKLSGSRRAVDPRTTLAAFRSVAGDGDPALADARGIATRLRAGSLLLGSVVGTGNRITLNASLVRTRDGREFTAQPVTGSADSLTVLIDRVVAALISLEAGESERRLDMLTSASLPALRAYLEGNADFRRGDYMAAVEHYVRAMELDSTFVLPALQLPDAVGMTFGMPASVLAGAVSRIRANRDRLTPADRAYADVRWPEQPRRTVAESIEAWEALARAQPDRPEVWYQLGDVIFHNNALMDDDRALQRARAAFEKAYALDSLYFVPFQHIVWVAHEQGDTAFVLKEIDRYLARTPTGISAAEFRIRRARLLGDTAAVSQLTRELDGVSSDILLAHAVFQQILPDGEEGVHLAWRAVELLERRAATAAERATAALNRYQLSMNAGRPAQAMVALRGVTPPVDDPHRADQRLIFDAVYWDGDTVAAAAAFRRLRAQFPRAGATPPASVSEGWSLCALLTWRVARGDSDGAPAAIERLGAAGDAGRIQDQLCALTLDALLAHQQSAPDSRRRLERLDSLLRLAPNAALHRDHGNIVAARLWEAQGELQRALAAARRVLWNINGQYYRATFFELEGRYAAALGRRDEAIAAWTSYLALRGDPEPSVAPRVEQVRRQLARLTTER